MMLSRSFKISLAISTLIHLGAVAALNQETVAQKILSPPETLLARRSKPEAVRFELVETPASAEAREPAEKTNLVSDKNTRAQDMFRSEKKLEDSPHMEGRHDDSKDTRTRTIVKKPPEMPQEQRKPAETEEVTPSRKALKETNAVKEARSEPPKPPVEPEKKIEVTPEPKKKEVIRLAKKLPEPAVANPPAMTPRVITAASSRNSGADAQITGELSFGATRHFFGEYLLTMKQAVERQWVSHLVSQYTGIVSSSAVIEFNIQPDGTATDIFVSSNEGDSYFPVVCASSINDAQPFDEIPYDEIPGLPDEFRNKPLSIRFTFHYN